MTADKLTHLRALAARCREATGPSRELDAEIAVALRTGLPKGTTWPLKFPVWQASPSGRVDFVNEPYGSAGHFIAPNYTTSLDAIVAEIERALPGAYIDLTIQRTGRGSAGVVPKGGDVSHALAATPALALCAALLEALAAKEEGDV